MPFETLINKFLKIFFRFLYHQFAWAYDIVAYIVSFGQWEEWVSCTLPYLHSNKILEIGSGPGHLLNKLLNRNAQQTIIGIDASPFMINLASRNIEKTGKLPKLVHAKAQALPFPANSFHQVVSTFPTEYALDFQTILEVKRVLSSQGEWIILPGIEIYGETLPYKLLKYIYDITQQTPSPASDYLAIYQNAGFQVNILPIQKDNWACHLICCKIIDDDN